VLLSEGAFSGKIAVITEIIDQSRVIIDGPTTGVPRQSYPLAHVTLTALKLTGLPRGAGAGVLRAQLEKEGTVAAWEQSAWALKRAAAHARRSMGDFQRFQVMVQKKQRRDAVRKAVKASA